MPQAHVRRVLLVASELAGAAMITLEQLEALPAPPALLPADIAVGHLPALQLTASQARALGYGQEIAVPEAPLGELRLYGANGLFLGLGRALEGGIVRSSRLFAAAIAQSRN